MATKPKMTSTRQVTSAPDESHTLTPAPVVDFPEGGLSEARAR